MSDENWATLLAILTGLLTLALLLTGTWGDTMRQQRNRTRTEAIERGHAEWTPAREFRWLDNAE